MRDAFELTDHFECPLKLAMAFGLEFLLDAVRQAPGNIITEPLNGATRSSGIWPFLFTGRFLYFTNWCPHGIEEPVYATVSFQGFLPAGVETFLTHSWLVGVSKPLLPPHTTPPFKSEEGSGRFNLWKMWWAKWPHPLQQCKDSVVISVPHLGQGFCCCCTETTIYRTRWRARFSTLCLTCSSPALSCLRLLSPRACSYSWVNKRGDTSSGIK